MICLRRAAPRGSVILTKVRIQNNRGHGTWLWILTFVRMTVGLMTAGRGLTAQIPDVALQHSLR